MFIRGLANALSQKFFLHKYRRTLLSMLTIVINLCVESGRLAMAVYFHRYSFVLTGTHLAIYLQYKQIAAQY